MEISVPLYNPLLVQALITVCSSGSPYMVSLEKDEQSYEVVSTKTSRKRLVRGGF